MVDINELKYEPYKYGKEGFDRMVNMIEDQTKPFIEEVFDGYIIRTFKPNYPEHLYKWHSDPEYRIIEVLEDSDWRFQYDNELPIPLITGVDIKIPKGVIHRIIKGTTSLKIKIILD